MKYFLVTLPDDMYEWIREKAHKARTSMAEVIRHALTLDKDRKIFTKDPITVRKWNEEEWSNAVKLRDNFTCKRCSLQGNENTTLSHHILPKKKGGKNTLDNGETLCLSCHRHRHVGIKRQPC